MENENMKYCPVHKTYHHTCNNPNHAHNHKKHFHVRKTFLSKVHIIIFGLSIALLIIISLISLILAITNVNYPRIFLFGIMIYIATFICGGGVIGSYGPIDNQELNYIYMRKCVSIAMLIICIILFPFFFFTNINFFISVQSAKNFCLENDLKSKGDYYIELTEEKEKLNSLRNNFNDIYKNSLTCFEKQKCVKSILDSDSFICNYKYAEIMKENINCKQIFEAEHILNNVEDKNVANFVSSCLELKKDIFRCNSYLNLCKEDTTNNDEENKKIEKYYEEKENIYKNKIFELDNKLKHFDINDYSYENICLSNFSYNIILILTGIHILINFGISITWIILGIFNILKNFGFVEDYEKKYYKEMLEKTNKIYEQMRMNKNEQNNSDENTPLNINMK